MKCNFEGYVFLYDCPNLKGRVYHPETAFSPVGDVSIPVLLTHGRTRLGRERIGTVHRIERRSDGVYCKGHVSGFSPHRLAIMSLIRQGKLGLSAGTEANRYFLDSAGYKHVVRMPIREISLTERPSNPSCKAIVTPQSVAKTATKLEKTLEMIRNCKHHTEKRE